MRINKELFLLRELNGVVTVSTGMNENHNTGRRYALNPKEINKWKHFRKNC